MERCPRRQFRVVPFASHPVTQPPGMKRLAERIHAEHEVAVEWFRRVMVTGTKSFFVGASPVSAQTLDQATRKANGPIPACRLWSFYEQFSLPSIG